MDNSNSNTNDNGFVAPTGGSDITNMTDEQIAETINNMSYDELIENYAEGLIYERGLDKLDDDLRAEAKRDLIEQIDTELNVALANALTDEQAKELDEKIARGEDSPEEVRDYLTSVGINVNEITAQALEKFHQENAGGELNTTEK